MKSDTRGWVYFIGADGSDLTKIGFSTRPRARLSQVQSGNPERLAILYVVPATKSMEAHLHELLSSIRAVGEWFRGSDFVRLLGEQIMALHFARMMKRMGLEGWPTDMDQELELYRRARANKLTKRDLDDAVDFALAANADLSD